MIFGKGSGFGTINLAALGGSAGFRIQGQAAGDFAGRAISAAGDVNGDGYDDILIGANGNDSGGADAGAAYVIFGRSTVPPHVAPSGTDAAIAVGEDGSVTLTAANFGFGDGAEGDSFTAVTIASIAGGGSLRLNGTAVSVNQSIAVSAIDAGQLVFTPAPNANGNGYASFTFQVQDNGPNNAIDLSANTITFNVTAVDDLPVAVADSATVSADTIVNIPVVANDTDIDAGPKFVALVDGTTVSAGVSVMLASGAIVTLNVDGTLGYDPNGAFDDLAGPASGATNTQATDQFTYALNGGSAAIVTVTINGVAESGDTITGDGSDNVLIIGSAPGSVDGGGGHDRLVVRDGRSIAIADNAITGIERITVRDGATLDLSAVHDRVARTIASLSLGGGDPTTIIGTQGSDTIVGGLGADDLSGGDGNDFIRIRGNPLRIDGGDGFDRLTVGGDVTFDNNRLTGIEKILVEGGVEIDLSGVTAGLEIAAKADASSGVTIIGAQGNDLITGSDNGDVLTGGAGRDIVRGGLGADTFVFASVGDFAITGLDRIFGFSRIDGDTIDLSAIDPDAMLAGDQAFSFIGDANFTGATGSDYEVRAVQVNADTSRVFIDVDHDKRADYSFLVATDPGVALQAADFSL